MAAERPLETILGDEPRLVTLLQSRQLRAMSDLVLLQPWELRDIILYPEDDAKELLARAYSWYAPKPCTAKELLRSAPPMPPLAKCLAPLGILAHGGFEGSVVEVAGPAGTGKTQLSLHLAAATVKDCHASVFWLDTEGTFSAQRILELLSEAGCSAKDAAFALGRIHVRRCQYLQELTNTVKELLRTEGEWPALVVIDSVAAAARLGGSEGREAFFLRQKQLGMLAGSLKSFAAGRALVQSQGKRRSPTVIVTNQVFGGAETRVALGHVWHHAVNWRFVLSHLPPGDPRGLGRKEDGDGRRFFRVEKSPSSAPLVVEYGISAGGICRAGLDAMVEGPEKKPRLS